MKMKERMRKMLAEERFREILKIVNEKNSDCNRADRTSWILQSLRSEET